MLFFQIRKKYLWIYWWTTAKKWLLATILICQNAPCRQEVWYVYKSMISSRWVTLIRNRYCFSFHKRQKDQVKMNAECVGNLEWSHIASLRSYWGCQDSCPNCACCDSLSRWIYYVLVSPQSCYVVIFWYDVMILTWLVTFWNAICSTRHWSAPVLILGCKIHFILSVSKQLTQQCGWNMEDIQCVCVWGGGGGGH